VFARHIEGKGSHRLCNGWARKGNGIQGTRGGRGRELGSGHGWGRGGGAVEGQGAVGDVTFRDSDGGVTRAGLSAMRAKARRLDWARMRAGRPARRDTGGEDWGARIEKERSCIA
jgi:hypothetical protein